MINFHELALMTSNIYSFVGIKRENNQLIFYLPKGFDISCFNTYESRKELFFLLFKILKKFQNIYDQKYHNKLNHIKTPDRDGVIRDMSSNQSFALANDEVEEIILYSKVDFLDSILNIYDDIKILSSSDKLRISEEIDYSKLHLFLERAIYLNNDAAYVDNMTLSKLAVLYQSTDIVSMYCYILVEIKQHLQTEINSEVLALAQNFYHKYIGSNLSLFDEESNNIVVNILKETLELIDKNTVSKSSDYWEFYDAIELFLYGELSQGQEGEIWGINNFYCVWESMCLTHLTKTIAPKDLLYLDTRWLSYEVMALANRKPKVIDLNNIFIFNGKEIFPDAVIYCNYFDNRITNENSIYLLKKRLTSLGYNWYDNNFNNQFHVSFICELPNSSIEDISVKITYTGQGYETHTFYRLSQLYETQDEKLIINTQLPSEFYSYWDINLDNLNHQILNLMFHLNHIFYVAFKLNITEYTTFKTFFIDNLELNLKFKEYIVTSVNYTKNIFDNYCIFIKKVAFFEIVDIKYLQTHYFLDSNNFQCIKEKIVRKQFVYEYLLQNFIKKQINFKDLEIISNFWLPSWMDENQFNDINVEYLNGYIGLKNINFLAIVDTYLE
ncbi:MAG TPA: hypothetical protein V6D25_12600 [Leptolyngbyaceae cyanobacterium]